VLMVGWCIHVVYNCIHFVYTGADPSRLVVSSGTGSRLLARQRDRRPRGSVRLNVFRCSKAGRGVGGGEIGALAPVENGHAGEETRRT
jgi:hypothetical protein